MTTAKELPSRPPRRILRAVVGDSRGVVAVEFALVASTFMLLLIGSIQVGLLWWTQNGLQATAALTARCAALELGASSGLCTSVAGAQAFAVATASKWVPPGAITAADVTVTSPSACQGASGGYSQFTLVTITSTVWKATLLPLLSGDATLKATACYPSPN